MGNALDQLDQAIAALGAAGGAARAEVVRLEARALEAEKRAAELRAEADARPRIVYVSSSAGDDDGGGASPARPVKTLARGYSLLRDGRPDQLLLKRGDTWGESLRWNKSGLASDPIIVGAYGEGPGPKLHTAGTAFNLDQGDVHSVAWQDLHLAARPYGERDTGAYGIRVVVGGASLTVQRCRIEGYRENLAFAPPTRADRAEQRTLVNIRIQDNLILDAWSVTGGFSGQGLFCDNVDGLLLEGNVFDHNGWSETVPGAWRNQFRHNVYQSERVRRAVTRRNVFSRAASHGIQMRGGGVLEENLFVDNAIGATVCGADSTCRRNVFVGGTDISDKLPRGRGLTVESALALVEENLFAHKGGSEGVRSEGAIFLQASDHTPPGGVSAILRGNLVWDWYGNAVDCLGGVIALEAVGNDFVITGKNRRIVNLKTVPPKLQLGGNRYWSDDAPPTGWMRRGADTVPLDAFSAAAGDATSRAERPAYPDPGRSVPADFFELARAGRADVAGIIRFIREGFGR